MVTQPSILYNSTSKRETQDPSLAYTSVYLDNQVQIKFNLTLAIWRRLYRSPTISVPVDVMQVVKSKP